MPKWNSRDEFLHWCSQEKDAKEYLRNSHIDKEEQKFLLEFAKADLPITEIGIFNEVITNVSKNNSVSKETMLFIWKRAHKLYADGYASLYNSIQEIVSNNYILEMFEETEFSDILVSKLKHTYYCNKIFEKVSQIENISYNLRRILIEKDPSPYLDNAIGLVYDEATPPDLLLELLDKGNSTCIKLLEYGELPEKVFDLAQSKHGFADKVPNTWIAHMLGWS
jgi:hypothetical protein